MQGIRNIIFDLGGIFMNLDYSLTEKAFIGLGIGQFPDMFTQHHVNNLFEELETGAITSNQFYQSFREMTGTALTDEQIEKAWNAMLLDFPAERLEWLSKIADKYRVFLFSNTNQVHLDAFRKIYTASTGRDNIDDYFISSYYSNLCGFRKPYAASFRKILEKENLIASETLFIDDTIKNIVGAREAGLHTIHLVPPMTVLDLDL